VSAAPFAYARPDSLGEAAELLVDPGARALAGGQSLIPLLARRVQRADVLVDLLGIPGLDEIRCEDGTLRLGALCRQRAAERSSTVAATCPLLAEALAHVGHPATRNRGTIGGSLAHADPAAELPAVAVALDANAIVRTRQGPTASRPVGELLVGPHRTALRPGELIVELRLPARRAREGQAWVEFAPRFADLPIVGAAAAIELGGDGRVLRVRAAVGGIGPAPADLSGALTSLLDGQPVAATRLEDAARQVAGALAAEDDWRGSAAFRRRLAVVLLIRALVRAARRAAA
jgi:aerobic carbon-monoxide dehydrogenase medium subunit